MSYHVIGITHDHKMQALTSSSTKERALERAIQYASGYRQLFLVQPDFNVCELHYTPPSEGELTLGEFRPNIAI